jgi:Flp pilus assembly protein TadG
MQRRGTTMLYALVCLIALFAVISLGVDWGRVQVAQAQLQGAADAAARYAVTGLQNDLRGQSAVESNAREVVRQNHVDGRPVNFRPQEDIEVGVWDPNQRRFTSTDNLDLANAVRVTLRKSAARNDAVPLTFAGLIGRPTADLRAQATAYTDFGAVAGGAGNGRFEYYIPATSNPWLSGMPAGTVANPNNPANNPDYAGDEYVDPGVKKSGTRRMTNWSTQNGSGGSDGNNVGTSQSNWSQWGDYAPKKGSPIRAGMIPIHPGATISFDGFNGGANNFSSTTLYDADGNSGWIINNLRGAENGMSDLRAPINSVIAVFLSDTQPSLAGQAPPTLDFGSSSSRDFLVLRPELRQMFFIGDGRTSAGETQRFVVPPGATRLYIGTMDGWEWNNNIGGFEVTAHATGRVVLAR